mmetsp:Transcript_29217/g.89380  ORF Transcript_29217/g.89380 Transcript_29217/m.89380 type:complete len:102 (-) Transcript_29217:232-537(-)
MRLRSRPHRRLFEQKLSDVDVKRRDAVIVGLIDESAALEQKTDDIHVALLGRAVEWHSHGVAACRTSAPFPTKRRATSTWPRKAAPESGEAPLVVCLTSAP